MKRRKNKQKGHIPPLVPQGFFNYVIHMPNKKPKQVWQRYTKLNGDPVHIPAVPGALLTPDTQVVLGTAVLACAASWYMGAEDKQVVIMAFNAAAGFLGHQVLERLLIERHRLKRHFSNAARFCIDKYPSSTAMVTRSTERNGAAGMRREAMMGIGLMICATPLFFTDSMLTAAEAVRGPITEPWQNGMLYCCFWLSWMARNAATFVRFDNVVRNRWNIVFPPAPPQRREERAGVLRPGL